MSIQELLDREFATIPDLIALHAQLTPAHIALIEDERRLDFAALDRSMNRVAAALQRDSVRPGAAIAICAASSIEYAATFLGAVRAGVAVAPLAPSSTSDALAAMLRDCAAAKIFVDRSVSEVFAPLRAEFGAACIALDGDAGMGQPFERWLAPADARPEPVAIKPDGAFN